MSLSIAVCDDYDILLLDVEMGKQNYDSLSEVNIMFGRKDKKMNDYQNSLVEQHYTEIENIYRTMRGCKT
jgi:hypothetical protein